MKEYDHKKIETKWQKKWAEKGLYKTPENPDDPHYVLDMFPYPSGSGLHVGHVEGYTGTDVYARFLRMQGQDVLHPMGWDAFGLPAENYAVETGVHPRETTDEAIDTFKEQIDRLGLSYDWDREINTSAPDYYRWTQWLFLELFKNDLAEKKPAKVNWCPGCQTVLANEQVVDGECDRCDSQVVQKELDQWFFSITKYADELVDDLEGLDWPNSTKQAQRSWVGRQEGARFSFSVSAEGGGFSDLEVFTTRPDTLFGVTYLAVAPEHELVSQLLANQESGPVKSSSSADGDAVAFNGVKIKNQEEVEEYVKKAEAKTDRERQENKDKTGVKLEGVTATHPATGDKLPLFVADYVLSGYGTGAIMAVPAHDVRDHAFAKKYDLPERHVVMPSVVDDVNSPRDDKPTETRENVHAIVYDPERDAYLALHSKKHEWKTVVIGGIEEGEDALEAAKREVREETGYTDIAFHYELGGPVEARYFAKHKDENRISITKGLYFTLESEEQVERIDDDGEVIWVPAEDFSQGVMINSELPHWLERISQEGVCVYEGGGVLINSGEFDGSGSQEAGERITEEYGQKETTYRLRDWSVGRQRFWGCPIPIVYDPEGQPHAVPEEHLPWELPSDVEFEPTGEAPLAKSAELKKRTEEIFGAGWTPETATLDTFVDSSWYFLRFTDPENKAEFASPEAVESWCPVDTYVGGAEHSVMHLLYARFITKVLADLGHVDFREPFIKLRHQGLIMAHDGTKMSKSKGNVVNPNEVIDQVGADTLRLYELFAGPFAETVDWNTDAIAGPRRFLERVWRLAATAEPTDEDITTVPADDQILHRTIQSVGEDIAAFKFNTAISSLMELVNELQERKTVSTASLATLLRLLAPLAPHITEELWERLGGESSVHAQPWPVYDKAALKEEQATIAIQVDGTLRGEIKVSADADEAAIVAAAKEEGNVADCLKNKTIERHIYVPGRLVNFVLAK